MRLERMLTRILLAPILPSTLAFSNDVKRQVRERANGICEISGQKVDRLEIHHRLCQSHNGSDRIENAIALAGFNSRLENGKKAVDTHEEFDKKALKEHLYLNPDNQLVRREDLPPEYFKNKKPDNDMPVCRDEYKKLIQDRKDRKALKNLRREIKKEAEYYIDPNDINADVKFRK